MRVAIVNDLALAREALRRVILSVPEHQIAWMAEDGAEAVWRARMDPPDVLLMDLVMPGMDGVEATRRIMAEAPCPILIVTACLTTRLQMVYDAMSCGGLDVVSTPVLGPDGQATGGDALLERLARLAQTRHHPLLDVSRSCLPTPDRPSPSGSSVPLVVLAASTGGPDALAQVLAALPASFASPVVVIQHIAAEFAANLVVWLRGRLALPVEVAQPWEGPKPGRVSVAASNDHLILRRGLTFEYVREPVQYPYRPSANVFFESAATWPGGGIAVVLTGMGTDGAQGLLTLRQARWLTIAQDKDTSVVYGMPKAAAELHAACRIMPLDQIGPVIVAQARKRG